MRGAAACVLLLSTSLAASSVAFAQRAPQFAVPLVTGTIPQPAKVPAPAPVPARTTDSRCANPSALGVARTVEIDTTGGPGFGFEHFKQHDFLRDKEVVLTFDDGPWPTTPPC